MKLHLSKVFLIGIIILGTGLRFWQLGNVPISPNWDEVALAYEANSIFLTGKDTYGEFLPPVLRSFDDYKPALYSYLAIPVIELFGLTSFAIRIPSAIFGIIGIIALYYLVKELFSKYQKSKHFGEILALLSSFLLAISPWHLQFSRIAFESNIGLTCNILIALFFIKGLSKPWLLIVSALLAGINLSIYQSERVFTPLLLVGLIIIYRGEFLHQSKKYLFSALLVFFLAVLPLGIYMLGHPQALIRVKATSIFSNQTEMLAHNINRLKSDDKKNDTVGKMLDNRRIIYLKEITSSYLSHFDLKWLFLTGDINRHHAPRMGLLFIFTLPFILIGIYFLLFGKFDRKTKYFIFFWILIAPIPASVTFEVPHAVRTLNAVPIYQIITALGLIKVFSYFNKSYILHKLILIAFVIFSTLNVCNFINQYFVQQNYFNAPDWQYGYKQTVNDVENLKKEYKKIVVSDKQPMDKSFMFFLFYLKFPSQEYQDLKHLSGSFESPHAFGQYEFRKFIWEKEKIKKGTLFIGSPRDFPDNIVSRKVIYYPDGDPAILFVDPEKNL